MGLENLLDQFVRASEYERNGRWIRGDVINEAMKQYGEEIVGKFAEHGDCTKNHIKQIARISEAFPQGSRYADKSWSFYRAVFLAAQRTEYNPTELLKQTLEENISQKHINRMGKNKPSKSELRKTCEWCSSVVYIKADGGLSGAQVTCPVCGDDYVLGILE